MGKAIPVLIDGHAVFFEVDPVVTVALPDDGFVGAEDVVEKIDQITDTILQVCRSVHQKAYNCLEAAKPKEFEIEFGVTLGGEIGIPLVSKGSAEAQIKVTARWS
jgi:hypothetical protein